MRKIAALCILAVSCLVPVETYSCLIITILGVACRRCHHRRHRWHALSTTKYKRYQLQFLGACYNNSRQLLSRRLVRVGDDAVYEISHLHHAAHCQHTTHRAHLLLLLNYRLFLPLPARVWTRMLQLVVAVCKIAAISIRTLARVAPLCAQTSLAVPRRTRRPVLARSCSPAFTNTVTMILERGTEEGEG